MSSKSLGLSVLVLLSVLNTYSLPIVTLYKAIQLAKIPNCPVFRNIAEDTPEPEYLQGCLYPLDPKSNDLNVIRCNLYLNQFNLMCELALPKFAPPVFLSSEEVHNTLPKGELNPCDIFSTPINVNNSSNIDSFIAEKCKAICTDIRTDEFETICLAASYLRMVANMSANKTQEITQIDASGRASPGIRVSPPSDVRAPVKIEEHPDIPPNIATSGNDALPMGPTGNAAPPETSPSLTELQNNVIAGNTVAKLPNEHESNLGKGIGDVVISGGAKITEEVQDQRATVEQKKQAVETTPDLIVPKSEEISKSIESVKPPKIPISLDPGSIPEKVAVTASQGDSKSTAPVKHDIANGVDDTNQETALEADYTDKGGFDIDTIEHIEHNPSPELESNIPSVIIKHPGMTEDEDEKLVTRNMYRDDRTVEDDSYFFTYFMMLCVVFIFAYVGYHNKQKIIAIVVEGRRGSSGGGRGGRSRGGRRPNSANYHKLDSNLEEAVSSNTPNKNTSKVIY